MAWICAEGGGSEWSEVGWSGVGWICVECCGGREWNEMDWIAQRAVAVNGVKWAVALLLLCDTGSPMITQPNGVRDAISF